MFEAGSIEIVDGGIVEAAYEQEWKQLHRKLRAIAKERIALEAKEIGYLVEAEEMSLHRRLGYATILEYMERELGWGPQSAKERMRVAYELIDLPMLHDAFAAGERCFSVVRELTRVATAETEETWLDRTLGMTARQVEGMVAGRRKGDLPDDPVDPALVKHKLFFEVLPETFAAMRQVRVTLEQERGESITDDELLQTMCRRSLETAQEGPTRPATQLAITTCRACKRGWQVGAGTEVELSPASLERARCDAEDVGDLESDKLTRVTPTIPLGIKRKVFIRDKGGCTVPGCRSRRNLDCHHVVRRADGGKHTMAGLTLLCSMHHQQLHDGLLSMTGQAPELVFRWHRNDDVESAATPSPTWDRGEIRNAT